MDGGTFALVPVEVIKDKRLTLEQMRVLIALFSFRNKVTNLAWPSRALISERTGMHVSNISAATTALVELGWLTKSGVGGHSKSSEYVIQLPDFMGPAAGKTVAHKATVADSATVAQAATTPLADSATTPLADSAIRKEQTKEHTKEQKGKAASFDAAAHLAALGVDAQIAADWLVMRKEQKASVSLTVIAGYQREAAKLGVSLEDAVRVSCMNNWRGFNAGWASVQAAFSTPAPGQNSPMPSARRGAQHKYAGAAKAIFDDGFGDFGG